MEVMLLLPYNLKSDAMFNCFKRVLLKFKKSSEIWV